MTIAYENYADFKQKILQSILEKIQAPHAPPAPSPYTLAAPPDAASIPRSRTRPRAQPHPPAPAPIKLLKSSYN